MSLSTLNSETVYQAELALVEMLQDEYPSADLSPGRVLRELVIKPAAMFYTLNNENLDNLRNSMSLLKISEDPALADATIVDGVMSNLMLTRDEGAAATGQIRVILESKVVTPVDKGAVFSHGELTFTTISSFIGVTSSANVVNTSSRLITQRADGYYEFLIDVEASDTGLEYNVEAGARFTTTANVAYAIDFVAATDFAGGRTTEDNAALAEKAQLGLSPKVLSGRTHIEALLKENFPSLIALSIIGFGDSEMKRDANNMFGISQGGKVDIYVQTANTPQKVAIQAEAVVTDAATKTLRVTLDRDTIAGVYDILAIYRSDETPFVFNGESEPTLQDGLPLVEKTYGADITAADEEFVPTLINVEDAAFTRYQQVTISFTDGQSTLAEGETDTYNIYVLKMPYIAEIQDFINQRSVRSPGTDYLVKAVIPVMCTTGIEVEATVPSEVNSDAVKSAVSTRINALNFFTGKLPGSIIIDAAQGQLPTGAIINLPITMSGTVYLPTRTTQLITGTDELPLTNALIAQGITKNTAVFFMYSSSVEVSVS